MEEMPDYINNPAYGIYNNEYLDGPWAPPKPIHKDSGHPPIAGGKWCEECRKDGIYSWLDILITKDRVDVYKACPREKEHAKEDWKGMK